MTILPFDTTHAILVVLLIHQNKCGDNCMAIAQRKIFIGKCDRTRYYI